MYTFTKLHDRRIPKVRVGAGVGPMEFKLEHGNGSSGILHTRTPTHTGEGDVGEIAAESPVT